MSDNVPTTAGSTEAASEKINFKSLGPFAMVPAPEIESYDAVPWFRKAWFVHVPLLLPALIIAATGNFYAKATEKMKERADSEAEVWRSTAATRVFVVLGQIIFLLALASIIW